MQNRVFPNNGDGRPKRATPAEVADTLSAVRAGDAVVCRHFAQQVVALLDRGVAIVPRKPAKKAKG